MWWIQKINCSETEDKIVYLFSSRQSYVVSRKTGDLVLTGDSSVSRKHCTIHVAKRNNCPFATRTLTGVWIVDEGSKYGTFIRKGQSKDWVKVEPKKVKQLEPGDIIRFGVMENAWSTDVCRLLYRPILACTSAIPKPLNQELKTILAQLDGELLAAWNEQCTVVLVSKLTLTVKVVLALIHGIPILTTSYLEQVSEASSKNCKLPDMESFMPEIGEPTIHAADVSLSPKKHRRQLFKGKRFVFPTKVQLDNMEEIVRSAGGSAELLEEFKNWNELGSANMVVIRCPLQQDMAASDSGVAKKIKDLESLLKMKYGKRLVRESEIAQAIAYASIEKHCNPSSRSFELKIGSEPQLGPAAVLVGETPLFEGESQAVGLILDSTPTQHMESGPSTSRVSARKRSHSPDGAAQAKRPAMEAVEGGSKSLFPSNESTRTAGDTGAYNTVTRDMCPAEEKRVETPLAPSVSITSEAFWNIPEDRATNPLKRKPSKDDDDPFSLARKRREAKEDRAKATEVKEQSPPTAWSSRAEERVAVVSEWEDDSDFITVTKPAKPELDPLNSTIIMLSLVTLAQAKRNTGGSQGSDGGLQNVKTFKKQQVVSTSSHVQCHRPDSQSDDEDWTGTTSTGAKRNSPCF